MLRRNNMYHTTLCDFGLRVDRRKAFSLECTVGLNPFLVIFDFLYNLDIQKKIFLEDVIWIQKIKYEYWKYLDPLCLDVCLGIFLPGFCTIFYLATKTIKTWICKLECFLYLHKRDVLMVKHVPWENSGIAKTIVSDVFSYQYTFYLLTACPRTSEAMEVMGVARWQI